MDERRKVWLAQDTGVEHGHVAGVYEDYESAMRWLRLKHQDCQYDAARTYEYMKRDYAQRAAEADDPKMREHYEAQAKSPDVRKVGDIEEFRSGAAFSDGDWERHSISEYEVKKFRAPTRG